MSDHQQHINMLYAGISILPQKIGGKIWRAERIKKYEIKIFVAWKILYIFATQFADIVAANWQDYH